MKGKSNLCKALFFFWEENVLNSPYTHENGIFCLSVTCSSVDVARTFCPYQHHIQGPCETSIIMQTLAKIVVPKWSGTF